MSKKEIIATHKRNYHDYQIIETFEAGIVLKGQEVKSIRAKHVVLKESYARSINDELYLCHCHIRPFPQSREVLNPERDRKLLLKRREINEISKKIEAKGFTLVPLKLYIIRNKVKCELGLAQSKKKHDKRRALKDKDVNRQIQRALKS